MSGAPRVRSMNVADSEARHVFGPAGNKAQRSMSAMKPLRKVEKSLEEVAALAEEKNDLPSSAIVAPLMPLLHSVSMPSVLHRQEQLLHSNLSLNASCSSDASTDSFHSRASTGRMYKTNGTSVGRRQLALKPKISVPNSISEAQPDTLKPKKRCAWVTPNTEPRYAAYHDEEWGLPVHDDKKLFELLVFSGALAELTWPSILRKRQIFREVFADFDPITVAKFNENKLSAHGSTASSLLSERKLRAIVENARQISKVIDEFGSFDRYIWSFVNYKPIISRFCYPRQIPVKTPKADAISKDLVSRGFRSVGPTVIYSFMQVAGITNDHLISCFRFQECVTAAEGNEEDVVLDGVDEKRAAEVMESEMCRAIDELGFASKMMDPLA